MRLLSMDIFKDKRFSVVIALLLTCVASLVSGATLYVAPATEVPIRTGRDNTKKIVAVLSDGTQVELLKEEDSWALVRTKGGKEGWMLRRYLTEMPPPEMLVSSLKRQNRVLREKYKRLEDEFKKMSRSGTDCEKKLAACMSDKDSLRSRFERLKEDSADVIQTKKVLLETQKRLSKANAQLIVLKQKVNSLETDSNVKWFVAGGGILLLGWLLGLFSRNSRRRRPSLL